MMEARYRGKNQKMTVRQLTEHNKRAVETQTQPTQPEDFGAAEHPKRCFARPKKSHVLQERSNVDFWTWSKVKSYSRC